MACWAAALGDCSDRISREHIVSKSLFKGHRTIRVQGLPWCKNAIKEVGLNAIAAKVLCNRHNSLLATVDAHGALAFDVIREIDRINQERRAIRGRKKQWKRKVYRVNGPRLEQWFLKTTINILLQSDNPILIGPASGGIGLVDKRLTEIAFGIKRFEGRAGLYAVVQAGQQINLGGILGFASLRREATNCALGGLFYFHGMRFLLYTEEEGPPDRLTELGFPGDDWGQSQLNYRNRAIFFEIDGHATQEIRFEW